jgi:hypothetical protein
MEAVPGIGERLREPRPVRAQGMAMALLLLTDPERPLWGTGDDDELERAIIEVEERLDTSAVGAAL